MLQDTVCDIYAQYTIHVHVSSLIHDEIYTNLFYK